MGWWLLLSGVFVGLIAIVSFKSLRGMDQARGLFGMLLIGSVVAVIAFVILTEVSGTVGDWILKSAQNGQ